MTKRLDNLINQNVGANIRELEAERPGGNIELRFESWLI